MRSHLDDRGSIDAERTDAGRRGTLARRLWPWALAVVLWALALGLRFALDPVLADQLPYFSFFVAVALTAYFATPAATALATVAGYVAATWFFVPPQHRFLPPTATSAIAGIAYFAVCGLVAATSHLTSRAKARALADAAELARRHEQFETSVAERDRAEESLRDQSRVATELLKAMDRASVCDLMAERIHAVAGGAIVTISEFDPRAGTITVRSMRSSAEERERAIALLGRDPVGLCLKLPEEVRRRWRPGELEPVPGGLHELLFRQVPAEVCEQLARELGLGDVFGMACAHEEDILGTVAVVTHGRGPLRSRKLIEALVAQTGLALKRIRAEDARQDTEQRFRLLFETTSDGIWIHTLDGVIREVNDAYCAMSGYARSELEGMHIGRLEAVQSPEEVAEHIQRVVRGGGHDRFESRHRRKDGSTFDVDITALLERSGARMAIFTRDITDRKRIEEALLHANARLAQVDRRKNEFLAVLSHELRNPLAPIRNSVYVMERAPPGGEQAKRALRIVERQVSQLARLTDDLLDVTRISRGKVRLQREPLELNEVVRGTSDDLRELFARHGVRFESRVTEEPLRVNADRVRIAQVIGNLLHNAAKFTASGGRAEIALRREDGEAVVEVRDDGAGIEPELLARLFEPFVQAEKTLDRTGGGLGLGLALVKGLVELHGGTVRASSEGPGKGTLVSVRLPLDGSEEGAERTLSPAPVAEARRVLVVEDSIDAALSLKEALELSGHAVDVAFTGREGIEKALSSVPDVVLCDIGLPDVDGYGVARALRGDERTRSILLVALSGYALQEDVDRAREAGFDRHVAKPPDLDGLRKLLAEVPGRRRPAG